MEDVITAAPPPSRFFTDDLDVFVRTPPPTPPPMVVLPSDSLRRPSLLLIAASTPSVQLFLPADPETGTTTTTTPLNLAGTLVLPDLPISHSANLYTLPSSSPSASPTVLLVVVSHSVPSERSRGVAKALLGAIHPDEVLILDSISSCNFRGRLSVDEPMAFKLETTEKQKKEKEKEIKKRVVGVDYLPSGSVMVGLGAALLGECQLRKVKATLVGTWPDKAFDPALVGLLTSLLPMDAFPALGCFLNEERVRRPTILDSDLLYA